MILPRIVERKDRDLHDPQGKILFLEVRQSKRRYFAAFERTACLSASLRILRGKLNLVFTFLHLLLHTDIAIVVIHPLSIHIVNNIKKKVKAIPNTNFCQNHFPRGGRDASGFTAAAEFLRDRVRGAALPGQKGNGGPF